MVYFAFLFFFAAANGFRFQASPPQSRNSFDYALSLITNDLNSFPNSEEYGLPWERTGLFEGDIAMNARNTVHSPLKKWILPIPVYINTTEFNQTHAVLIEKALIEIEEETCIRFRQYQPNDLSYIVVRGNSYGCYSQVGRQGGYQVVHLQRPNCMRHGIIVHEFLHALGLYHQQSATERDDYVRIHWDNIKSGRENNFRKHGPEEVTSFNLSYDYDSIMHYSAHAFSKNGQPTISPLVKDKKIGQHKKMSKTDALKIRYLYDCPPIYKPAVEAEDEDEDYDIDLDLEHYIDLR